MTRSAWGFVLMLVAGVALGAYGAQWLGDRRPAAQQSTAVPNAAADEPAKSRVEAVTVEAVTLPRSISAVGSLRSENSVMLRSEVSGRISELNFQEGGRVSKGQVLVRLDDSVVRAELQQAQANLSLANSQYNRAQALTKQGFISKQARDEAASQFKVQQAAAALAK